MERPENNEPIQKGDAVDFTDYEVKLEIFQGPMDLLLHLIRKNEVDIFDIPIAIITDQYLAYLEMMKALNINVAGDFLVMASTLLHIKSRMLLPSWDEEDEDEGDPRKELTQPLLEYLRLKEAAGELMDRELLERDVFARQMSADQRRKLEEEEPLLQVNLFQLLDAFKALVEERLPGTPLILEAEKWSLEEKTAHILDRLKKVGVVYFQELFSEHKTISEFIITFLALLELVHTGLVRVFQSDSEKDIQLEALFEDNEDTHHV
jgi:segregation and condensation protein A